VAGASSGSGPVGLFFNRKTEVPRVVEHVGMWLLTVPEDGRERVVAQVESESLARTLLTALFGVWLAKPAREEPPHA